MPSADTAAPRPRAERASSTGARNAPSSSGLDVLDEIRLIRRGLDASALGTLADEMAMTKERLIAMLGVPRSTVMRKSKDQSRLSTEQSERVLGMMKLVAQVGRIVEESGDATGFDAAHWLSEWLEEANPALGGRKPGEFMDTNTGQALVSSLIARMQSAVIS